MAAKVLAGGGIAGSINAVRRALAQSGGASSRQKLIFLRPDSSVKVRFLQEPAEFCQYYEHYVPETKNFVPAIENDPLDEHPNPRARGRAMRHLVNVLDLESSQIRILKMNQDLTNRVILRYQKYKTLLDRDYEIMREGSGFDSSYDITPESPVPVDIQRYRPKLFDLELYLLEEVDRYHVTRYAEEYLQAKGGQPPLEEEVEFTPAPTAVELAADKKAQLDEKYGAEPPPWDDEEKLPFGQETTLSAPSSSTPSAPESPNGTEDPWAQARAEGRPCVEGANGLCQLCGFDLSDCLSA